MGGTLQNFEVEIMRCTPLQSSRAVLMQADLSLLRMFGHSATFSGYPLQGRLQLRAEKGHKTEGSDIELP